MSHRSPARLGTWSVIRMAASVVWGVPGGDFFPSRSTATTPHSPRSASNSLTAASVGLSPATNTKSKAASIGDTPTTARHPRSMPARARGGKPSAPQEQDDRQAREGPADQKDDVCRQDDLA